ncbi:MAG: polymerase [Actinomycetota bacterium]|jgi:DNA polymerase-4|nr:polymerase [Actinomycetota bacterium]
MTTGIPILHVDMDAFYASVEMVKDPTLRGLPVIVGGLGGRGVVTSASYEARAFGVHSAMPIVRARRLCPHARYLANDFSAYQDYSHKIREVFESFTPLVEPLSLDEAFLDIGGSTKLFGSPIEIARAIKFDIGRLGLACTVGAAPNKFLAKLASTRAKPDGLLIIEPDRIEEFLHPLPVGALWGVGEQTAAQLRRLGLETVGDICRLPARTLERAVGDSLGRHLWELAHGRDDRTVVVDEPAKSVGSEMTFAHDLDDRSEIFRELLRLSDRTASRLRAKTLCGRTVTIKVRFSNFSTITRSKTVDEEIDASADIYSVARDLCDRIGLTRVRVRLLGVSMSGLAPGPPRRQLDLLTEPSKWGRATTAIDSIRDRFGAEAVKPATLLDAID